MAETDPEVTTGAETGTESSSGTEAGTGTSAGAEVEAAADPTIAAVRRKLHVTWTDENTEARLQDVVDSVSPRLAALLGLSEDHAFAPSDGSAWGLFLNGCLYEFSDAWDDFVAHYEREIQSSRLLNLASEAQTEGDRDAEAQG